MEESDCRVVDLSLAPGRARMPAATQRYRDPDRAARHTVRPVRPGALVDETKRYPLDRQRGAEAAGVFSWPGRLTPGSGASAVTTPIECSPPAALWPTAPRRS